MSQKSYEEQYNEWLQSMPTPPAKPGADKFEGRYVTPTSSVGTPDSLISSSIVGQSYNPYAASMARSMQPPQPPSSTFGGYGQQAPMAALAPYSGMAQSMPQPTDFFPTYIPTPEPVYEVVERPEEPDPAPSTSPYPVMSSDIPGAIPGQTPGVDFDVFENPGSSMINYEFYESPYSYR